jgi:hypothetical protein
MQTITKKHLSVRGGIAKFAEVTVGAPIAEGDWVLEPELFLNDRLIISPSPQEKAFIEAATTAVEQEEARIGIALCVVKIESSYVDAHPDAARDAALSAVAALIQKNET